MRRELRTAAHAVRLAGYPQIADFIEDEGYIPSEDEAAELVPKEEGCKLNASGLPMLLSEEDELELSDEDIEKIPPDLIDEDSQEVIAWVEGNVKKVSYLRSCRDDRHAQARAAILVARDAIHDQNQRRAEDGMEIQLDEDDFEVPGFDEGYGNANCPNCGDVECFPSFVDDGGLQHWTCNECGCDFVETSAPTLEAYDETENDEGGIDVHTEKRADELVGQGMSYITLNSVDSEDIAYGDFRYEVYHVGGGAYEVMWEYDMEVGDENGYVKTIFDADTSQLVNANDIDMLVNDVWYSIDEQFPCNENEVYVEIADNVVFDEVEDYDIEASFHGAAVWAEQPEKTTLTKILDWVYDTFGKTIGKEEAAEIMGAVLIEGPGRVYDAVQDVLDEHGLTRNSSRHEALSASEVPTWFAHKVYELVDRIVDNYDLMKMWNLIWNGDTCIEEAIRIVLPAVTHSLGLASKQANYGEWVAINDYEFECQYGDSMYGCIGCCSGGYLWYLWQGDVMIANGDSPTLEDAMEQCDYAEWNMEVYDMESDPMFHESQEYDSYDDATEQQVDELVERLRQNSFEDLGPALNEICFEERTRYLLELAFGEEADLNLSASNTSIPVLDLTPCQNEIGLNDSLKFPLTGQCGCANYFNSPVTVVRPIVTYNGQYIVDGHHRWGQVYMMNPDAEITAIDFTGGSGDPEQMLRDVQGAIAVSEGYVPSSEAHGINVFETSDDEIREWIDSMMVNSCEEELKELLGFDTREEIVEYLVDNARELRDNNTPIPGAPDRNYMPQTTDDALDELEDVSDI